MFNGIWLDALEPLLLDREVQTGERFEISRTKSGALLVMGKARISADQTPPVKEVAPAPRRRGRPRKTQTEQVPEAAIAPNMDAGLEVTITAENTEEDANPPTGRYRRRDLRADS